LKETRSLTERSVARTTPPITAAPPSTAATGASTTTPGSTNTTTTSPTESAQQCNYLATQATTRFQPNPHMRVGKPAHISAVSFLPGGGASATVATNGTTPTTEIQTPLACEVTATLSASPGAFEITRHATNPKFSQCRTKRSTGHYLGVVGCGASRRELAAYARPPTGEARREQVFERYWAS